MQYTQVLARTLASSEVDYNLESLAIRYKDHFGVDMPVTLRSQLARPLTSKEMDANFQTLDAALNAVRYPGGPVPAFEQIFSGASFLDPRITFTRAGTSTYIENGVLKTAAVNVPVFENGGFRLRPAETNLFFPSDIATPTSIQGAAFTTTTETQADPTGTSRAVTILTTTGSAGAARYGDTTSGTTGNAYTGSIWVKTDGASVSASIATNGATAVPVTIGLQWTRVSGSAASGAGTNRYFDLSVAAGAAGVRIFVACSQIEVSPAASPYIPTTTAAVTRPADSTAISGSAFTGMFNPLGGAVVVDIASAAATGDLSVGYGSTGLILETPIGWLSGYSPAGTPQLFFFTKTGGGNQAVVSSTLENTRHKVALSWDASTVYVFRNGVSVGSVSRQTNSVNFIRFSFGTRLATRWGMASIFLSRPTDAQMQAMTTI